MSETVTVLRSYGRLLAKRIGADGTIENYDQAKTFDLFEISIPDLCALERLLHRLECRLDCCIVRGAVANPVRTRHCRRLLHADPETGEPPTLCEVPRRWLPLDFDHLNRPHWIDHADLPGCACVAIRTLPDEFQRARFIAQATASHGVKPGIRIRLWYWLSRPILTGELKHWLRRAPVDPSIFSAGHLIYTARPQVAPGAHDLVSERIAMAPGKECVEVPPAWVLRPPRRSKPVTAPDGDDRALDGLLRFVAQAPDGQRNQALYWAARRMAEKSVDQQKAQALLEAAALQAGLEAREAAATIVSGLRHD